MSREHIIINQWVKYKEAAMADHGTFYWNEFSTTDIEGAKAF